ncbi:MAG TPA: hypothetical protein DD671_14205 [Balneolaceae bacterium]|nr:hypothetical protein [Balneolaceae bacterium]|tara:strand:- start:161 stop:361 length:201 start_codon:yes stop_codon:yes gene_type:complete
MNIFLLALITQTQLVSDMETDARALELFLQDRKDHSEYCPETPWEQPDIEVYKETLESQLPEGCKE